MFTGLIQGLGAVTALERRGSESRLEIEPRFAMEHVSLGESIAVNGVCLTVERWGRGRFLAYASAETLAATSLGGLRRGELVNLERALALGDRLGGHLVSGHVDCLAVVESVSPAGESRVYRLRFPEAFGPQVVPKGSVALDGVSLTINNCGPDFLEVNIIPATQRETTIQGWSAGRNVNMETDLIGKYVQRMLGAWQQAGAGGKADAGGAGLTEEFLRRHGY